MRLLPRLLVPKARAQHVPVGLPALPPQPRARTMEAGTGRSPRVAIRYFDGCPHWRSSYERLNEVLAETGYDHITVWLELVETPEEAERLRFAGSPTILLDGEDPFAADATGGFGLSCRVYRTSEGPGGSPTKAQLGKVVAAHLGDQEAS
jgi:hypothetical protein